ncbi:mucin TcMUCII, putative [Trypanosoma cruzi marinkellei]|uniref:Mucin TcMUCII, putative n=1 Tax=Trypanosoma cruzi marinkellei TaxID=85056 RepID=K2PCQ9_TRYCR|nr:mucin TcMUCII, putative [Trypanosoma cruzi marinkellei]
MMMTCRLLCALLVLALCCCPSVCATQDKTVKNSANTTTTTTTTKPPADRTNSNVQAGERDAKVLSPGSEGQGTGKPGPAAPPVTNPAGKPGETAGAGSGPTGTLPGSGEAANTVKTEDTTGATGPQSDTNKSKGETDQKAEESAETTTTTAPEATTTTTTTTEAPTVSTTHAPSRLRKIDGSLSSSAWVCAPLLLAASALAYTAVS